ncbi:MAG TPA: 50S ribosomal protein L6 [Candidatus Nanoarchaeia archaeon]|nr:50S ribosomal protein L6 [Candidatus Nanoarchaeia archaeon]
MTYDTTLIIPKEVSIIIEGQEVSVKGPRGSLTKSLYHPLLTLSTENNTLHIKAKTTKPGKREKIQINTFSAHLNNLINGVQHPYLATLKICSGHFPITVTVEGRTVHIKNFLGEKSPRKASLMDNVTVRIDGDQIFVEGPDLEHVSQTAARIEQATRITNRDRRVFQDGCYITQKAGTHQ